MTDAQQLAAAIKFDATRPGRELLRQALTDATRRRDKLVGRAIEADIPAIVLEELEELEEAEATAVAIADLTEASLKLAEDTFTEAQEALRLMADRHDAALADLDHARSRTAGARQAAGVVKTADGYRRAAR